MVEIFPIISPTDREHQGSIEHSWLKEQRNKHDKNGRFDEYALINEDAIRYPIEEHSEYKHRNEWEEFRLFQEGKRNTIGIFFEQTM